MAYWTGIKTACDTSRSPGPNEELDWLFFIVRRLESSGFLWLDFGAKNGVFIYMCLGGEKIWKKTGGRERGELKEKVR